jgi:hypothetical protein
MEITKFTLVMAPTQLQRVVVTTLLRPVVERIKLLLELEKTLLLQGTGLTTLKLRAVTT